MNAIFRSSVLPSLALGLAFLTHGVAAQQPSAPPVTLSIDAQPMERALQAFAKQSGFQVIFPTELARDLKAPQISGSFTPQAALSLLLRDSDLDYEFVNERTVAVKSIIRVDSKGHSARNLQNCLGLSSDKRDSSTSLNETGRGTDCKSQNAQGNLALVRVEETEGVQPVQPNDGESSLDSDLTSKNKIQEIVVTAQKRIERLQDVPIAISVLSGEKLDSFTGASVNEALAAVPGVKLTTNLVGGTTKLVLRGVSGQGIGGNTVAYYVDSVPFGLVRREFVPDPGAFDLERVEVLRGPQGTLYGASALNGVVRILTQDADLNEFGVKARALASTTKRGSENYGGNLAVNVPIIEGKLAARAVLGYSELGGWIDNLVKRDTNDTQQNDIRLKINAQPTDRLSLGLSAWRSHSDIGKLPISRDDDVYPGVLDAPVTNDFDTLGLNVGYEFSGFSVSSTTSYIDYENYLSVDWTPFTPIFGLSGLNEIDYNSRVLAQEVLFSSTRNGPWRWTAGGFYRDAKDRTFGRAAALNFSDGNGDTSESFALFGELTRVFMGGKFELTGGLRYFEDKVRQFSYTTSYDITSTFDNISPRFVLAWHPSDELTAYASYAEGFRSGFNQTASALAQVPNLLPIKEDKLDNYELGVKGGLLDGRVNYEMTLYFMDWSGVQQSLCIYVGAFCFNAGVNANSASGLGTEFAINARPVNRLQLGVSVGWNDLTADQDIFLGDDLLFNKGDRLNASSEYNVGASVDYAIPLGATGLEARGSASFDYGSSQRNAFIGGFDPGEGMRNVRAGLAIASPDHWTVELFADNATNARGSPTRSIAFDFYSTRVRPRTIGLQFEYRL